MSYAINSFYGNLLAYFLHQWSIKMPFVNIKITREGATTEQKEALIAGVTQLLVDTMGKNPATTVVIIEEVETDNWGIGGKSVTELRKKK
ncbi:4-oxalocrotonate tautomerase [Hafnia alvei]|jgi:4-oxalocrotonate tautomerase|nr:4-oxalocrotonate tautomerase [Hafnia alvei]